MSIYATLWTLQFPAEGDYYHDCGWIEVVGQGVPPHVGTPTDGFGYERGDPYADFLPPAVIVDSSGDAIFLRAVVIVTRDSPKGTPRSAQEYVAPLLIFKGQEYAAMRFEDLHARVCDRLRGDRPRVVAEISSPDGKSRIIRE